MQNKLPINEISNWREENRKDGKYEKKIGNAPNYLDSSNPVLLNALGEGVASTVFHPKKDHD